MKTRRILVALSFCLLVSLCNVSNAYAYNTFNQHKLTYGVFFAANYGINNKVTPICLKSISDFADEKKGDGYQSEVCIFYKL